MKKQRILFIGAGRMAEAIVSGLLKTNKGDIESITMSNQKDAQRLKDLQQKYGVYVTQDWRSEIENQDVIVLAMPPAAHDSLLAELSGLLTNQFVVTIAAGIGPSYLEAKLPPHTAVAWIMPNTSATIGESISLYTIGAFVTEEHKAVLEMMLEGIGKSQECTEEEIHQLTAITGSAPAFLYYFAESLIKVTEEYGIDKETAEKLVIQMIYGSSLMLKNEGNPAALREQVTTPGGATAEGLKVLYKHQFADILKQAIEATNAKARGNDSNLPK
jgi:pyrroline-5-carboxylate reductase